MIEKRHLKILIPNSITALNIIFSFLIIVICAGHIGDISQPVILASWIVVVAAHIDGIDGKIARLTRTQSAFGMEFDSLADFVVFGLAPSVIVAERFLEDAPLFFFIFPLIFTLATCIRLARFNVYQDNKEGVKTCFQGLPSPTSAGLVVTYILLADFLQRRGHIGHDASFILPGMFGVMIIASILMLTRIEYDTFYNFFFSGHRNSYRVMLVSVFVAFCVHWPAATFFFVAYYYTGYCFFRYLMRRSSLRERDLNEGRVGQS